MPEFVNPDNSLFQLSLNSEIYVDKTDLIKYTNIILESSGACICNSRPPGFGKSCTADMLAAYYSKGAKSLQMFSDLKIGSDKDFMKYLNHYDVIQLDIQWFVSECKDGSDLVSFISKAVIEELRTVYPDILNSDVSSLSSAITLIYEKTGNRFVFIVDNWDAVIRNSDFNELEKREYMRFLNSLFKGTEPTKYTALVWMTGILPILKEKIFLLNNIDQFTMLDPDPLAQFMGFTEDEVRHLCSLYHQDYNEVKHQYGGYHLGGYDIFNPGSIVSQMLSLENKNDSTETVSSKEIKALLSLNIEGLKNSIAEILEGTEVKTDTRMFANDPDKIKTCNDAITYLIHLGYFGFDENRSMVFVPNETVRNYWTAVLQ